MSEKIKAILLLSGGLDSSTVCAIMRKQGREIYALTMDYNQRHRAEIEAAKNVAKFNHVKEHLIFHVGLDQFGGSALTDDSIDVTINTPINEIGKTIPTSYVPARNTIFLSIALAYAETRGANEVWLGVNKADYGGYPDCRPEYIAAYQKLANLATASGIKSGTKVVAPLQYLPKEDIIATGIKNGVDYSMTRSCYQLTEEGKSCGKCESCIVRKQAFTNLGMKDPTPYV